MIDEQPKENERKESAQKSHLDGKKMSDMPEKIEEEEHDFKHTEDSRQHTIEPTQLKEKLRESKDSKVAKQDKKPQVSKTSKAPEVNKSKEVKPSASQKIDKAPQSVVKPEPKPRVKKVEKVIYLKSKLNLET